ncbi:MAG: xseA [Gammaproteobacteria bacterium]|jgi:exodeoxyribonuclease VII large subunit|nr:xseA [Gammaproteobacteria bacterium]
MQENTLYKTDDREILSVAELNQQVRFLLEETFPPLWITGEISNFVCPSSGHWYFSLKDAAAQVRCAMFRNRNARLGLTPENGMQVIVKAKISLYEGRGDYQLIVEEIEEAGNGALLRAFEALKKRLHKEGLFEESHKKPLPRFPRCAGIITSATGAALHDILSVLERRFPSLPVIVYPSQVQGEGAAEQLIEAILAANRRNECDVLILTRGGGSIEDLWCFNNEKLAHAIFNSHIPIVSAVGHEIDFTIADFVADKRAATPSAAAELISPNKAEWLSYTRQLKQRLIQTLQQHLKQAASTCVHLRKRLRHPAQQLREYTQRIDALSLRLQQSQERYVKAKQQRLENISILLNKVSPLATLSRGYAIVEDSEGNVIKKAEDRYISSTVRARLAEGTLLCEVIQVNEK